MNKQIADYRCQQPRRIFVLAFSVVALAVCAAWDETGYAADAIIGFTEPVRSIDLAASETGTLAALHVKPGDHIRAGALTGSLDSGVLQARREFAVARQGAQAKLKASRIRLARAKKNYERFKQLHDEGHGGKRELENAESDYELAIIDVQAVEEESKLVAVDIRRIDAEIRRRQIISPVDGVVSEIHHEIGEYVSANDPNVLTIVDLRQLKIRFDIAAAAATQIDLGDAIPIRFAHSRESHRAAVDFIAPVINADSNTIRVDLLLENNSGKMRSGRRCELLLESHQPASTQPELLQSRLKAGGNQ